MTHAEHVSPLADLASTPAGKCTCAPGCVDVLCVFEEGGKDLEYERRVGIQALMIVLVQ